MKKIKILSIITILILGVILYACSNDEISLKEIPSQEESLQDAKIPSDMGGLKFGNLTLPKGTISKISENGSKLDFKLPNGYTYIATDESGKVFLANEGSYTCTSTCSGGCDVAKLGNNIGCSACPEGSAAPCTGKRGKTTKKKGLQIGDGFNGRIVEIKNSIKFLYKETLIQNKNVKSIKFDSLLNNFKIRNEFYNFVNSVWKGKIISDNNYKKVLANIYGTTIVMYVPKDYKQNSKVALDGSNVSCNCNSGSSGCDLEGIFKGLFRIGDKCVAGSCNSCTMSW
jgi:hypothetical protein